MANLQKTDLLKTTQDGSFWNLKKKKNACFATLDI